jgi:HK97 gp10 family phage protein
LNSSVSYIKSVIADLEKAQEKVLDKAAAYLWGKLKDKVSKKGPSMPGEPPGYQDKNLLKGIKFVRNGEGSRLVGVGPPASHAHLLEFGTGPRIVKNYMGHPGVTKDVRPLKARPFMAPTFAEEANNVADIISEKWI